MDMIYDVLTEPYGYGDIARRIAILGSISFFDQDFGRGKTYYYRIAASFRWEDLAIGEQAIATTQWASWARALLRPPHLNKVGIHEPNEQIRTAPYFDFPFRHLRTVLAAVPSVFWNG